MIIFHESDKYFPKHVIQHNNYTIFVRFLKNEAFYIV